MNRISVHAVSQDICQVSFGFALLDNNHIVQEVNPRFASMLQKAPEELLSAPLINFFPEMAVFKFDKPHEFERFSRTNGQFLAVDLFRVSAFPNHCYWIFCRDRTNYRQLQFQYDQLTEQLLINNQMFNALYDGLFVTDGRGQTLYVNDSFLKLSGLERDDVVGKNVYELMEKKIVPNSCSAKVLETKEPASIINNYYQGRSCLVSGTPVFKDGELVRVVSVIRDVTELQKLNDDVANAKSLSISYRNRLKELEAKSENSAIISTRSKVMKNIYETAMKVASVDSPILILGETGVGKDYLAKFIHNLNPCQTDGCFVTVNCNAIPPTLMESELFGYEAGAFSGANRFGKAGLFELAQNGTLFLDEIGDLPLNLQVKLLHAIQERCFYRVGGTKVINLKSRVIAATNVDLEKMVNEGKFRSDLYYRLSVIVIRIPPLRHRRDDIVPLALHFLEHYNTHYKKQRHFSPKTIEILLNFDWPGNIREMKNIIERLVIMSDQDCIEPVHFGEELLMQLKYTDAAVAPIASESRSDRTLRQCLDELEATVLRDSIQSHKTLKDAATALGIDLSTLVRKQQKYNIYVKSGQKT